MPLRVHTARKTSKHFLLVHVVSSAQTSIWQTYCAERDESRLRDMLRVDPLERDRGIDK